MRKSLLTVILSLVLAASLAVGFGSIKAHAEFEPTVAGGVMDERVPLGHNGGNNGDPSRFGSLLIEEGENRGQYELLVDGGWGSRYTFDYALDLDGVEISVDVSHINPDGQFAFIFGAGRGDYLQEEYGGFGFKIYRHTLGTDNKVGVVISNRVHSASIETMTPAPVPFTWDSINSGYEMDVPDNALNIKIVKSNAQAYSVTLNETVVSIPTDEIVKVLGDNLDNVYLMVGSTGDSQETFRMTLTDKYTKEYDANELPAYKAKLAEYETAANAAEGAESVLSAEKIGRDLAALPVRAYDEYYYSQRVSAAAQKILNARNALAASGRIGLFKGDIDELARLISIAKDNDGIAAADAMCEKTQAEDDDVLASAQLGAEQSQYEEQKARFSQVKADLEAKRYEVVESYVEIYEENMKSLSDAEDVRRATESRQAVQVNLQKLDSSAMSAIALRLVEYQDKLEAAIEAEGWTKSSGTILYNDGNALDILSSNGQNSLQGERNGSTVTLDSKVKANAFTLRMKISEQSMAYFENYVLISISKEADNVFYAMDLNNESEVEAMHSNPGLVIMFDRRANDKYYAEVFMVKTTHSNIYTASRGQMLIDYKLGQDLEIEIRADNDSNSTYTKVYFNGVEFTGTPIKNSEIKNALGGFEGYLSFSFAKAGSRLHIEKINGSDAATSKGGQSEPSTGGNSGNTGSDSGSGSEPSNPPKKGCGSCKGGLGAEFGLIALGAAVIFKRKRA